MAEKSKFTVFSVVTSVICFILSAIFIITAEITIVVPSSFYSLFEEEKFENEISTTYNGLQNISGFKKVEKRKDDSVAYTISRLKYNAYLKELRKTTADSFNNLKNSSGYAFLKEIDYNGDFSYLSLSVNNEYDNDYNLFIPAVFGFSALFYQMFDVYAPQEVTIIIKDSETDKIIYQTIYPEKAGAET